MLDQFLDVGGLNTGNVTCARFTPIPFPCTAGKDFGVLEGRIVLDLYVTP